MNFIYGIFMMGFGFLIGTMYNWGPRPEQQICPIEQTCPKLPENYFSIETIETEQCVSPIGETIISKVVKHSRVEIE
jgi:hypothetical protein